MFGHFWPREVWVHHKVKYVLKQIKTELQECTKLPFGVAPSLVHFLLPLVFSVFFFSPNSSFLSCHVPLQTLLYAVTACSLTPKFHWLHQADISCEITCLLPHTYIPSHPPLPPLTFRNSSLWADILTSSFVYSIFLCIPFQGSG